MLWAAAHYGAASPALTAPSTLQALVLLALTDRAVNTRRAAGAVLQEIVGRRGAERVPQGLALLGLLNYAALGNAQWAFAALVPRVAALEAYGSCVLERMRWIAENQDDFGRRGAGGKGSVFLRTARRHDGSDVRPAADPAGELGRTAPGACSAVI